MFCSVAVLVSVVSLQAQFLTTIDPKTSAAFDKYYQGVENTMRARANSAEPLSKLPPGVTSHAAGMAVEGNGMVHDWSAIAFLPGRKKAAAIHVLEEFNKHASIYPEVIEGRLLKRDEGTIEGFHRIRKKAVIEVTLELNYEVRPFSTPPNRYASRSVSTKIVELEHSGKRTQPGRDHGFLWRLNTFWILEETPQGLWMECRSVSLSRNSPIGLGWAVNPLVREFPRESLVKLMDATKRAIEANP